MIDAALPHLDGWTKLPAGDRYAHPGREWRIVARRGHVAAVDASLTDIARAYLPYVAPDQIAAYLIEYLIGPADDRAREMAESAARHRAALRGMQDLLKGAGIESHTEGDGWVLRAEAFAGVEALIGHNDDNPELWLVLDGVRVTPDQVLAILGILRGATD